MELIPKKGLKTRLRKVGHEFAKPKPKTESSKPKLDNQDIARKRACRSAVDELNRAAANMTADELLREIVVYHLSSGLVENDMDIARLRGHLGKLEDLVRALEMEVVSASDEKVREIAMQAMLLPYGVLADVPLFYGEDGGAMKKLCSSHDVDLAELIDEEVTALEDQREREAAETKAAKKAVRKVEKR